MTYNNYNNDTTTGDNFINETFVDCNTAPGIVETLIQAELNQTLIHGVLFSGDMWFLILSTIYLSLIFLVNVTGNLLLIIFVYKYKKLQNRINFILVNHSLADIIQAFFCNIPMIIEFYLKYQDIGITKGNSVMNFIYCPLSYYFKQTSVTASLGFLVLTALERWFLISKRQIVILKNWQKLFLKWGVLLVWIISLVYSTPLCWQFELQGFVGKKVDFKQTIDNMLGHCNTKAKNQIYKTIEQNEKYFCVSSIESIEHKCLQAYIFSNVFVYATAVVFIVVIYFNINRKIKYSIKWLGKNQNERQNGQINTLATLNKRLAYSMNRRHKNVLPPDNYHRQLQHLDSINTVIETRQRLMHMLILLVVVFCITVIPSLVLMVYSIVTENNETNINIVVLCFCLFQTQTAINPILVFVMSTNYSSYLKKLLGIKTNDIPNRLTLKKNGV